MAPTARSRTVGPRLESTAETLTHVLTVTAAMAGGLFTYGAATAIGIPAGWRLAAAVVGGILFTTYFQFISPLLGLLHSWNRTGAADRDTDAPTMISPPRLFGRLDDAICADAAERAAGDSWGLDLAHQLLGCAGEWAGAKDGTARFDLAFDSHILYRPGPVPETAFTFVSPNPYEETVITSLLHLRELLQELADRDAVDTTT